jgi:hypothetical protein
VTTRAAACAALAICACAAPSPPARADSAHRDEPPATRFSAAFFGGPTFGFDARADGRPAAESGGHAGNFLFSLGIDRSLVRWLALGVEGRVGTWSSPLAEAVGYDQQHLRDLFDLDAVIRFRSPTVWTFRWPVAFSVSPSGGFTWPDPPSRETRAVQETWRPRGGGGNVGIDLTAETWFKFRRSRWQLGAAAGVAYMRHWFALDGTFAPVSEPGASVTTRYAYVTDMFLIKVAFLAGL